MTDLAPAARRGSITVEKAVLEKIAGQAAAELDGVGRATSGLVLGGRADLAANPKASVVVTGKRASISLTVGLVFPQPLARTGDRIRSHCADRIEELTGVVVDHVDVTVSWLGRPTEKEIGLR